MDLKPLGDRIVVKPKDEDESTTASGLVIPDTAKEKPQLGEVLAVGPGEFQGRRASTRGRIHRRSRLLLQVRGHRSQVRG